MLLPVMKWTPPGTAWDIYCFFFPYSCSVRKRKGAGYRWDSPPPPPARPALLP